MTIAAIIPVATRQLPFLPLLMGRLDRQTRRDFYRVIHVGDEGTGRARNHCCHLAFDLLGAEFGINFDVDDIPGDDRVEVQMAALDAKTDALVCGTSVLYCVDLRTGRAIEKRETFGVKDSSMCFRRKAWKDWHFDDERIGECDSFIDRYRKSTVDLARPFTVYARHPMNTVAPRDPGLYGVDEDAATAEVRRRLGADFYLYRAAASL